MVVKKISLSDERVIKIKKTHGQAKDKIAYWKKSTNLTREEARKLARKEKEKGYNARVTQVGNKYSVCIDQRPRTYGLVSKQDRKT